MIDPVRERQLQELDTVGICTRILYQARSELYVNMHFLDVTHLLMSYTPYTAWGLRQLGAGMVYPQMGR